MLHYWLGLEWIDRTTDPDDPEVRRRRAEDSRNKVKPPPYPLVPPVALRPEELAGKRNRSYLAEVEKWNRSAKPDRRQVSTTEFDRIMGLTAG